MSVGRAPRCQIKVNGQIVAPIDCNVHVSIHQSADTFEAKLPFFPALGLDAAFWSNTAPVPIEIDATNDVNSASFTPLFIGQVNQPQLALHENSVMLRGRDKTATLTETKTTQLWVNQTDQQIIASLAQAAGLTVKFAAAPIVAGLDLDAGYSQELSDQDTSWNMIVALARKAGCIAFVKGTVLYVQPIDTPPPNGLFAVDYASAQSGQLPSSKAVLLFLRRNLNLAKDMTVTLQSWQHQQGQAVTSSYRSKPAKASSDRTIYTHRAANLTKQQQDRIASAHLKETLTHERQVDLNNYPGDVAVIPGLMGLKLTGTGTAFDQTYILSDAVHRFTNEAGYMMDLTAHSQDASRGAPTQEQ